VRNLDNPNIVVLPNDPKQAYAYSLDRQWAIPTFTVKSNYFRFATITINFTHNELSNIVEFKLWLNFDQ